MGHSCTPRPCSTGALFPWRRQHQRPFLGLLPLLHAVLQLQFAQGHGGDPTAPGAPSILTRSPQGLTLKWAHPANWSYPISAYVLYARLSAGGTAVGPPGPWVEVYSGPALMYNFAAPQPGKPYDFRLAGRNGAGEGPPGPPLLGAFACAPPAPPTALAVLEQTIDFIALSWTAPQASGGCPLMAYEVTVNGTALSRPGNVGLQNYAVITALDGLDARRVAVVGVRALSVVGGSEMVTLPALLAMAPEPAAGFSVAAQNGDGVQIRWEPVPLDNSSDLPVTAYQVLMDRGWQTESYAPVPLERRCDTRGLSGAYSDVAGPGRVRLIEANGCPNHFSGCQKGYCDGTVSEAVITPRSYRVPASPILSSHLFGSLRCHTEPLGVALNGVPIFGPAASTQGPDCGDVVEEHRDSFDVCGGYADAFGGYRYNVLPTCLLAQLGANSSSHSPQIGWSMDGFPIYGPNGPGGIPMRPCDRGAPYGGPNATVCLDICSGLSGALPGVDAFLYRYYLPGPLTSLRCSPTTGERACGSAAGQPCCMEVLPDKELFPYTITCYKGCLQRDIDRGFCRGASGLAPGSTIPMVAGVVRPFDFQNRTTIMDPVQELPTSLALSVLAVQQLRQAAPLSPGVCFVLAALSIATDQGGQEPRASSPLCVLFASPPSAPTALRAAAWSAGPPGAGAGSLTVLWDEAGTDEGHPIVAYQVDVRMPPLDDEWRQLTTTDAFARRVVVEPCLAGTVVGVRVSAETDRGWGPFAARDFACAATAAAPALRSPARRRMQTAETLACVFAFVIEPTPDDGGSPPTGYRLYRGILHAGVASEELLYEGPNTTLMDSVSGPYLHFAYVASVINGAGEGPRSTPLELNCSTPLLPEGPATFAAA